MRIHYSGLAILKKDVFSIEKNRTVVTICNDRDSTVGIALSSDHHPNRLRPSSSPDNHTTGTEPFLVHPFDVRWVLGRDRFAQVPFGGKFVGVGSRCRRNHARVTAINDLDSAEPNVQLEQYDGTRDTTIDVFPSAYSGGSVQHVYDGTTSARVYIGDTVRLGKSYFTVVGLSTLPNDMKEWIHEELKWLPTVCALYDNAKTHTIIEDPVAFEKKKLNAIYQLVRAGAPAFDGLVRAGVPAFDTIVTKAKEFTLADVEKDSHAFVKWSLSNPEKSLNKYIEELNGVQSKKQRTV